jgi:outer membrane protein
MKVSDCPHSWKAAVSDSDCGRFLLLGIPRLILRLVSIGIMSLSPFLTGCVTYEDTNSSLVAAYQKTLAYKGPQDRLDSEGRDDSMPLGVLEPAPVIEPSPGALEVTIDPNTGEKVVELTIEQAIVRALANSPEIKIVSFDPEIARQEITKAAADFDPTVFSRFNYENDDNPENSIFEPGQMDTRLVESGVKQRTVTGAEWSASYALTRRWDDLIGRALPTRYEPVMAFQLRQPLLRDAGSEVNLAGVNIARLEHQVALLGFRQKAEEISTAVIRAYWQLLQARRELVIQQQLLARTLETLNKVEGRRDIDATDVQIQQANSYGKSRQGVLIQLEKRAQDAQDALARLLVDAQINTASSVDIVPVSVPDAAGGISEQSIAMRPAVSLAMARHPAVQHAKTAIEVADINIRVARNQAMPRLDLTGSANTRGLARAQGDAFDQIQNDKYTSFGVGLSFEYPLGDRQRYAELTKRRLERRKAVSVLHNIADQVATQVKERIHKVETSLAQIEIQREAVKSARIYLQALEDSEPIRERLTAEFLLVKLQAQELLAQAERTEIGAIVEFNIATAELAQATGTVLEMHPIETSLSALVATEAAPEPTRHNDDSDG